MVNFISNASPSAGLFNIYYTVSTMKLAIKDKKLHSPPQLSDPFHTSILIPRYAGTKAIKKSGGIVHDDAGNLLKISLYAIVMLS